MERNKIITLVLAIVLLISSLTVITVSFYPAFIPGVIAESNAPTENGTTNKTWYIETNDQILRDDESISTVDIQVNSTGALDWVNISCETTGDITVNTGGYFNVTDATIMLKGDLNVKGIVNFDNVTLIMNSTFDGEFGISVNADGSFFIDDSNITAYDTWTPSDLDTGITGYETWGYHYNFTVNGNMSMSYCDVSYVWGRITTIIANQQQIRPTGGLIIAPSDSSMVNIAYSNFTKMETTALNIGGSTENITISNNRIFNIGDVPTWYGFGIYSSTTYNVMINYNEITKCTASGIFLEGANCTIYGNNISHNGFMEGWTFTTGIISWVATPKIIQNNISFNYGDAAIYIRGLTTSCVVKNNNIFYNNNTGIDVLMGDPILENNNINNNTGDGILISTWKNIGPITWVFGTSSGQVKNNTIEFNNETGINCDNNPLILVLYITTNIDNNSINNNNLSGIYALNCNPPIKNNTIYNNQQDGVHLNQRSNSFVYNNSIFNNTLSGLYVVSSSPDIEENDLSYNNWTGIECTSNSNPSVEHNTITNNDLMGIYLFSNSDVTIRYNDINDNNWSGIQSYGSSPNIRYNDINSNNQNGIYLYQRGTTTIRVRDNNITYNGWNGIECNLSSPVISMNNITNNSRNGLFLNNSSPTVQNNNQIMYNQFNGIACYLGSAPTITNDLKFNTLNGLYVNGSSPLVQNSMISNNSANGIYATAGSSPNIENSTIAGNTEYAINITGNSHPASLNSSIDDTKIYFDDTASSFSVQWFLHVRTVDDNNALLGMVDIWVNTTTQMPSGIWSGQTRPDGLRPWLHVTEYVKTDNNGDHDGEDLGEFTDWNPYNITADKFGYGVGYAVPEPTIDQSMWVTVKLPKNIKPLPVSNIKPDITHDLRPTITWDPSIDPDGQSVTYWINVGTWPNGTNEVFNQSTTNTNYTFTSDLSYGDGVNTYFVLVYADDGDGGFSRVNDQFDVINNAPTQPGINITPRRPNTLMKSLTCTINTTSIDLDSDDITYTYRWYKNGVPQNSLLESATTELSDTISVFADGITFVINDNWMCRVTANDGFVASLRDEDSVTFLNLDPAINPINDLYMDEDSEVTNWINLSEIFEDPDPPEDGTPYKFWVTGNENITITIDFNGYVDVKPDPDWNGQETVTFWANDTGSKTPQVYTEALINVLATNDVPNLVSVGKITIEEDKPVSFLDTKGARQDQEFRLQIVAYDIDIENGEVDALIYTSNSSRITVDIDSYDLLKANLTFTPDNMDVFNKKLFVRLELRDLEDGIIDDYVDIIIEVRNKNDPPTIISFTHEELDETFDVTVSGTTKYIAFLDDEDCAYEDQWYNLTINGYDPDPGDVISYDSDDPRFFIKPDPDNKFSSIISFKPTQAEVGTIEFNITAMDSEGEEDNVMVRLLIKNVNDRPDAKILKPTRREFDIGETIDFEGDVYDEDLPDDGHTYQWISNLDGELGTTITLNEVELTTGVHDITFTVTDQGNLKDSMSVTITIGGEDTDRDGLPDNWEEQYFNSLEWSAEDDPDNDKLTNLEEYGLRSDPSDPDSPTPQTSKSGGDDGADMAAIIGVVITIVIIIILILVFLVLRKRKSQEGEGPVAGAAKMQPQAAPEKIGYTARPVPTLDELFPEGVPEEEVIVGKPKKVTEEESIGKKEKTLPVEIGLPPEELRKELRKKSKREEKKRDDEIKMDDRFSEEVLFRPEADEELIFERPESAAEFQPMHEIPEEASTEIPDSPFAGATIKELDEAKEEPIIMDREPGNLDEIYKKDDEEE